MPKVTGGIIAAILAVLLLTGCANTAPTDADETPSETAAPLVAETPATASADDADAAFLAYVREHLPANTQIPDATDQQLLDAGHQACERLDNGEASDQISLIDGEERNTEGGYFVDSGVIITAARQTICPA